MKSTRAALVPPALALLLLCAGAAVYFSGADVTARTIWFAGLILLGVPLVLRTALHAARGRFATDIVAALAIIGAILLSQPLAGLVVVLMQTGGEALERYAEGRASRALQELEQQAPRVAHLVHGGDVDDVPVERVAVGDTVLVRPGELVPCDGVVIDGEPSLDLSRLTGEPLPVTATAGTALPSGGHNLDAPFHLRVTRIAGESEYARIVELVRNAQESKAPLQRLADRYATWFTPATIMACAATYLITHDPVRVLAVLVVATPCPLILATPVAIIGGINRAASRGIVFRNGSALEQLATTDVVVFDKTGTLTIGRPEVAAIEGTPEFAEDRLLALAAAIERGSGHLLARTLVEAAQHRGVPVLDATAVTEAPGQGVSGIVELQSVAVGGWKWITAKHPESVHRFEHLQGDVGSATLRAYVTVNGAAAGIIDYADHLRPGVGALVLELQGLGFRHSLLLSGDRDSNVQRVAAEVGIADAHGDMTPADKTARIRELVSRGDRVLMLGDGTNDAPALSTATVGIALASGGGGIAAEAADAVILADDPTRVAEAVRISRRTLAIAHQSIWAGLGLSIIAMGAASIGELPPAIGAMVQEAIDVAVILNALRSSTGSKGARR